MKSEVFGMEKLFCPVCFHLLDEKHYCKNCKWQEGKMPSVLETCVHCRFYSPDTTACVGDCSRPYEQPCEG